MKIRFLGTNGWFDNEIGNTVCTLLESEKYYILFDAGNGIRNLNRYVKSEKPIYLFLSHLHLDHVFGLHILPKFKFKNKFTIICPKGQKKDLTRVIDHPYAMPFREMKLNLSIEELAGNGRNVPFPVEHKKLFHIDPSFGYRIKLDGKTIAYCSDTGFSKNSIYLARGADVLIHECAAAPGYKSGKWGHSNPEEAAGIAKKSRCKKLILTHFSANKYVKDSDRRKAEKVARIIFKNTTVTRDDMTINI